MISSETAEQRQAGSFADHVTSLLESISTGTDNAHSWPARNGTNLGIETITVRFMDRGVSLMHSLLLTRRTVLPTSLS